LEHSGVCVVYRLSVCKGGGGREQGLVVVVIGHEGAGSWSFGVREWGQVVVVRHEGAGGGHCHMVVVGRSPSLLWVRKQRWWVME
jgi:hypothetical protein